MTKRLFELATQSEWDALQESSGHTDVAQAVDYLQIHWEIPFHGDAPVELSGTVVKLPCLESKQHKKRESARQLAARKGFKIQTKFANGWLYLKRI